MRAASSTLRLAHAVRLPIHRFPTAANSVRSEVSPWNRYNNSPQALPTNPAAASRSQSNDRVTCDPRQSARPTAAVISRICSTCSKLDPPQIAFGRRDRPSHESAAPPPAAAPPDPPPASPPLPSTQLHRTACAVRGALAATAPLRTPDPPTAPAPRRSADSSPAPSCGSSSCRIRFLRESRSPHSTHPPATRSLALAKTPRPPPGVTSINGRINPSSVTG